MDRREIYDVTIIGGGPAGLYSAFYSGLRDLKTKIIEYQPNLGGKINIYQEKIIWDVGGLPPVSGSTLMRQIVEQGLTFNPAVVLNEKVEQIERNREGFFQLRTHNGENHVSKTVIVAVGSGIITPHKLNIEGAEKFEVHNLHYTVPSLKRFKDKTVVISGGGNSAIDWANELETVAKKVYFIYRNEHLKGHEAQVKRLKGSSIELCLHNSITCLMALHQKDVIDQVELTNHQTKEKRCISTDEVIINHGYERDASLLNNSSVDVLTVDDFYIKGTPMSESSVEGLFAAGDILHHDGKLHLIAGAFQDAANAVNKIKKYIQPDASKTAMVSSHNEKLTDKNKEWKQQWLNSTE
ncbi:NAD(P)/FAD-dependent oxidoreductase [Gracilibacillus sp. YIM 98692]|uniref:NAD(P)/FAD-dependent oxidoreductase n=1 Tax=Gracilibacillus sp. YIM 98692 TaxID=2663532 RepID=UPI0013D31FDC|nr:NAD(P)/FAD-dependent oxidoreductase [Gracilibacillus sp. YIM 98692]